MNELEFFDNTAPEQTHGFTLIQATEASAQPGHDWPVGHIIGYEHTFINLIADAITNMAEGKRIEPDFVDGYENQRVLDAVERSSTSKSWISQSGARRYSPNDVPMAVASFFRACALAGVSSLLELSTRSKSSWASS